MIHTSQQRRPSTRRLTVFKVLATAAVFTGSLVINQACGGFSGTSSDEASMAGVAPPFAIVATSANRGTGQTLSFGYSGPALPAGANATWSHIFSDSNGAPLSPCTELNGETAMTYQLNCPQAGILTLALDILDADGTPNGAAQLAFGVGGASTTPVATPPASSLGGAALFATNCASCHGSLASNNIGPVQVSAIQSAIQTQAVMNSLATLTTAQLQAIANALNGR